MRTKNLKKIVALGLSFLMLLPGTSIASATELTNGSNTTTITTPNTVKNPVFRVVVPTALEFAVDPFELKGETMIYSPDYAIVNKSNVAIQVDAKLNVKATDVADPITFVATKDAVTEADTVKRIWFATAVPEATDITETMLPAADIKVGSDFIYPVSNGTASVNVQAVSGGAVAAAAASIGEDVFAVSGASLSVGTALQETDLDKVESAGIDYTTDLSTQVYLTSLSATDSTLSFALDKAANQIYYSGVNETAAYTAMASGKAGSAMFRFVGAVNTNAAWSDGDITASAVFTFNGKSDSNYDDLMTTVVAIGTSTDAHALVDPNGTSVPAGDTAPTATLTSFAVSGTTPFQISANAVITTTLGTGTKAATGLASGAMEVVGTFAVAPSTPFDLAVGTDYTYNATTGVFTILKAGSTSKYFAVGDTIKIKFNDTAATVITITMAVK